MMTNEQVSELLKEYRRTRDKNIRNKLAEHYMYIA